MSQGHQPERRRDPRLANNIPLKISLEKGKDFVTQTFNVSRSGAYCQVDEYVEPMTKLKISFLVPVNSGSKSNTKKVSCEGVVVRTEQEGETDRYNIAIFFNDISERDREVISDFIHENIEEGKSV